MDVTNLIKQLQSKITDNSLDQQMIAKAIKLLDLGAVEVTASVSTLPSAALNTGRIYYVNNEGLYWSNGVAWNSFESPGVTSLWGWGQNNNGLIGNLTPLNATQASPISVAGGFTDWCLVSVGDLHTHAIRSDGTLWGWGCLNGGLVGNTLLGNISSPVQANTSFNDWCYIDGSYRVAISIRKNGTAWAWGYGTGGARGDGLTTGGGGTTAGPTSVAGGFTDWCQISMGGARGQPVVDGALFAIGIRKNGTIWSWGSNTGGRLGDGGSISRCSPGSVATVFTDWTNVSAGANHSVALRKNGTLWSWGGNSSGQLGDGTLVNKCSPISVIGGFIDWCQVSVGNFFSLALRKNGTLWSWGANGSGQLGNGTTTARSSPVSVVGGFTDWCQVSAGRIMSAGIRTNGTVWTWGYNTRGQLGDNTTTAKCSPVSVVGSFTDWCQVRAGSYIMQAIRKIE